MRFLIFLLVLGFLLMPLTVNEVKVILRLPLKPLPYKVVTITTYSKGSITASGFKIDTLNPGKHRIIAISRDLKDHFKFGDLVKVTNAGIYNGIYTVRDLMDKKWKNRIDILIDSTGKHTKIYRAKLFKIDK